MYILGDIHGNFKLINDYKLRNCNIIQVGDFGLGFTTQQKDEDTMDYWNTSWKARGIHVYAIRGNHDRPEYWDGRYNGRWSNITLVPDYTVMNLEHKNWLFMGGAISIDRIARTEGRDYWKNEGFNYDEDKLNEVLKECDPIDYVVTHTAPEFCTPFIKGILMEWVKEEARIGRNTLELECQAERQLMARAYNVICVHSKPTKWFYGHFHMDVSEIIEGTEFKLLGIGNTTNVQS